MLGLLCIPVLMAMAGPPLDEQRADVLLQCVARVLALVDVLAPFRIDLSDVLRVEPDLNAGNVVEDVLHPFLSVRRHGRVV